MAKFKEHPSALALIVDEEKGNSVGFIFPDDPDGKRVGRVLSDRPPLEDQTGAKRYRVGYARRIEGINIDGYGIDPDALKKVYVVWNYAWEAFKDTYS